MHVAVAGGTGKLGRTLVEGFVADGRYEVVILAREAGTEEREKELGARILSANYGNVGDLTELLVSNNIEIVISTIDLSTSNSAELNLIDAAERSSVTKRFIPNDWSLLYNDHFASYFPIAATKKEIHDRIKKTKTLEHTLVHVGFFLDYWVIPGVPSYCFPMPLVVDMANNAATIPGTGDRPVTFTYSKDVARMIPALLSLPKWEEHYFIIGDKLTWNEFVLTAEAVKGVKFDVAYDPLDKLLTGQVTELPSQKLAYPIITKEKLQVLASLFGRMCVDGVADLKPAKPTELLNELFPDIKVYSAKELLTKAWVL
ncbi:hypothetical protein SEUCBS140593_002062 [Sporothrix eucalyptigena]|uniref:NmrA-like domain-containing protein n=1 Tax=Sporothrix eucalyptigena TaxID=1812306 RepID=A0ABP0B3H3_9PEZI